MATRPATASLAAPRVVGLPWSSHSTASQPRVDVVVAWAFVAVVTYGILKVVSLLTPLKVTPEDEEAGLDLSQHGESAYPDAGLAVLDVAPVTNSKSVVVKKELVVDQLAGKC
jgi:Amt family ammonium transporter